MAPLFLELAGSIPVRDAATGPQSVGSTSPLALALPSPENARRDQPLASDPEVGVALGPASRETRHEQATWSGHVMSNSLPWGVRRSSFTQQHPTMLLVRPKFFHFAKFTS